MLRQSLALVSLLFVFTPAWAEEPPSASTTPADHAAKVRATLPAPSPATRLTYSGDLTVDGLWTGEVTYTARAKRFSGENRWYVTESVYIDRGGAELHYKCSYYLDQDLALRSGSSECRHRGTTVSTFFSRKEGGYALHRTIKPPSGEPVRETATLKVAGRPTYGRVAVLLFLRGVVPGTKAESRFDLAWFPLWELTTGPAVQGVKPAQAVADNDGARTLGLTIKQVVRAKAKTPAYLEVHAQRAGLGVALHVDPKTRALQSVKAPKGSMSIVPRGQGGARVQTDEEKPAKTWQQAFLKFGYGYHMARPALIAAAFHWPSMYKHETEVSKSWDPKQPLDEFKTAWIKEFVAQSLHRPRKATDRLLSMTLATGQIKKQSGDALVFAAHSNFGGGVQRTYHLKRVKGLWYVWRIDF